MMTVVAANVESRVAKLADAAFNAFCEEMSSMFGVTAACERRRMQTGCAKDQWKPSKKLSVTHWAEATGALDGALHLFFDRTGLFVLAGVIVMLPEAQIAQHIKKGSADDAKNLEDATREAGNLLVTSWDRAFRDNCAGHERFTKKGTFVGKVWDNPDRTALSPDEEVFAALYEMTVGSYPSFRCAAIFPKAMIDEFGEGPNDMDETMIDTDPEKVEPIDAEADEAEEPPVESDSTSETPAPPEADAEKTAEMTEDPDEQRWQAAVRESLGAPEYPDIEQTEADADHLADRPAVSHLLDASASEIMTTSVVWADPDETVQQCLTKMQQQDCRYILVGRNGALEGIVSSSNLQGALSPYLRPVFAKWRRPEDDATLNIKIKWIMSRPVQTATPDSSIASIIDSMFRHGSRCLPVVDQDGAVRGIVTVFDILARILETDGTSTWKGRPR
jgi:CBS domain-containing protein